MIIKCKICGKEFRIKPSHFKKRKTCSMRCMAIYYRNVLKRENNPNWKGGNVKKICIFCGKKYTVRNSFKNTSKYCSKKCSDNAKMKLSNCEIRLVRILKRIIKERKKRFCINCGKKLKTGKYCWQCYTKIINVEKIKIPCVCCGEILEKYPHYLKDKKRIFCSDCSKKYKNQGCYNPNYKDGRKPLTSKIRECSKNRDLIKKILIRDNYICQECGQIGGNLQVDHIKKFSDIFSEFLEKNKKLNLEKDKEELFLLALNYKEFWNKNNLRVLCRRCNWLKEIYVRKRNTKNVF